MCRLWNGEFHGGSLLESDLFIDPWRREKEEGLSRGRSRIVVQLCRGPCCFNGRAATRMVLLNGHQTWWGARPLYPSLNPLWPVIGCRVTKGRRCDFGHGGSNERTQLRAVCSQYPQQKGLWMPWSWRKDLDSTPQHHYRGSQGFESWVYERVMVPSHSVITYLVLGNLLGGMVERRKLGRIFGFWGKIRLVLDLLNLAWGRSALYRSLEVW